tara:strand:+ start:15648 stop:16187 length:540 start_codon:yes stop_codon:yes gene_type:complete
MGKNTIGNFNPTDLGTKELHSHFDCELESLGKGIFRTRIKNQLVIDKLFINSLIDEKQHNAGEFIYKLASQSGIFPSSVNLIATFQDGGLANTSSHKSLKALVLTRITKILRTQGGRNTSVGLPDFLINVVCFNKSITSEQELHLLKLGLNAISERLYRKKSENSKDCCLNAVESVVQA